MVTEAEFALFARANGQTVEQYKAWLKEEEDEDG